MTQVRDTRRTTLQHRVLRRFKIRFNLESIYFQKIYTLMVEHTDSVVFEKLFCDFDYDFNFDRFRKLKFNFDSNTTHQQCSICAVCDSRCACFSSQYLRGYCVLILESASLFKRQINHGFLNINGLRVSDPGVYTVLYLEIHE